jgi:endonuclease/exonuclease/phosphatase (EEP) superfamily protein YafD
LKGFSFSRTTLPSGTVVDVYNLHMEAGGAPQDDALRDAAVTQMSTFINANSVGRALIVGGDFNLHTDSEPDSTQFQRLLSETGLVDVCAFLGCPQPGRIDKFLFRSSASVTLTPTSWQFETDVFVDGMGEPLSDHDALAVNFEWTNSGE